MPLESLLERFEARVLVGVLSGLDFRIKIGVAPQGSLREDDEAAGENVRALDRNADGRNLIGGLQIVVGAVADALAAVDVKRVVQRSAHSFRGLIFHEAGNDRRLGSLADHRRGDGSRGFQRIGRLRDLRERLDNALHAADRNARTACECAHRRSCFAASPWRPPWMRQEVKSRGQPRGTPSACASLARRGPGRR